MQYSPRNKYKVGDIVHVNGYNAKFEIIRLDVRSKFINGKQQSCISYHVQNAIDGTILHVDEDCIRYRTKEFNESTQKFIDRALDEYNDYMALYQMFSDEDYKDKADEILTDLKDFVNRYY